MNCHNTLNRKIIFWTTLLGELFQLAGQMGLGSQYTAAYA